MDQNEPAYTLFQKEFYHNLLVFGSLCTILLSKKLTIANIIILLLEDKKFLDLFLSISDYESKEQIMRMIAEIVPSNLITKRVLNSIHDIRKSQNDL